jgi:hypothetical protein
MKTGIAVLLLALSAGAAAESGLGHCGETSQIAGCSDPLTPELRAQIEAAQRIGEACEKDIERFCEGVQVGEGRIEACLAKHQKRLSKKCKAARQATPANSTPAAPAPASAPAAR